MNINVNEGDIIDAYRLNKSEETPIMVCLNNKSLKSEKMQKRKKKKSLLVNETGLQGKNNLIYFNDVLSPEMQELFRVARKLKSAGTCDVRMAKCTREKMIQKKP